MSAGRQKLKSKASSNVQFRSQPSFIDEPSLFRGNDARRTETQLTKEFRQASSQQFAARTTPAAQVSTGRPPSVNYDGGKSSPTIQRRVPANRSEGHTSTGRSLNTSASRSSGGATHLSDNTTVRKVEKLERRITCDKTMRQFEALLKFAMSCTFKLDQRNKAVVKLDQRNKAVAGLSGYEETADEVLADYKCKLVEIERGLSEKIASTQHDFRKRVEALRSKRDERSLVISTSPDVMIVDESEANASA